MKSRIKVAYLINELTVGGAEKLVLATAKYLDRTRFEPIMISFRKSAGRKDDMIPAFQEAGIPVHCLEVKSLIDFSGFFRLIKILNKEKPQILHTHLYYSDFFGRLAGRLCRIPVITSTVHMLETIRYNTIFKWLDRWTSRLCTQLIAVTEHTRQGLQTVEGIPVERVTVIPNAIETSADYSDAVKFQKREELGIPKDAFVVGIVSRLEGLRKGHRILFESIRNLIPHIPNLHCLVIGDGPDRQALYEICEQQALNTRIHFLGNRNDISKCLQTFDIFALPSYLEGMPIVLLEAMAAKLPIITTPVGGVPEFILHEKTGILIPPGDPKILAETILGLFQQPEQRAKLSEGAFKLFTEKYDMRQAVKVTEDFYHFYWRKISPPKIRVLLAATSFDTGGVTTYLKNLIQYLPKDTFELSLVSGMENFRGDIVKGLAIPHYSTALQKQLHPIKDLQALWQLYRLMRSQRWDAVHTHNSKADFVAGLAGKLAGIPIILSTGHGAMNIGPEGSLKQRFFDFLEKAAYRYIHNHVISVSDATTGSLLQKRKVKADQITTITNGIEIPSKITPDSIREKRKELGLQEDDLVIISVTRFKHPKTPEVLVKSISQLTEKFPNLKCLLVGEGPGKDALIQLIEKLGLAKHVLLLGERPDSIELLRSADIFVLSTLSEGASMSLLEAMASGLPCVASRVGGNINLIEDGVTGFLTEANNFKALTDKLLPLLQSKEMRSRTGSAARSRTEETFSISSQINQTKTLLETLVARSRHDSKFERLKQYIKEEGLRNTAKKIVKKLVSPLYLSERLWFLMLEEPPTNVIKSRLPIIIRTASVDDVERMRQLIFTDIQSVKNLISSPNERCFIAEYQNQIIATQWVQLGGSTPFRIDPFGYGFPLEPDDIYFHDSRTLREFRGQGVMGELQMEIYLQLHREGYRRAFTDIKANNETSLSLLEKVGMMRFEQVTFTRIFGVDFVGCKRPRGLSKLKPHALIITPGSTQREWPVHIVQQNLETRILKTGPSLIKYLGAAISMLFILLFEKPALVHFDEMNFLLLSFVIAFRPPHITLRSKDSKMDRTNRIKKLLLKNVTLIIETSASDNISGAEARASFKIPSDARTIGTLTTLNSSGKPWDFISFCEKYYKFDPKAQFLLAGDGPLFLSLKLHSQKSPLAKQMRIVKKVDRKQLVKAVDVFISSQPNPESALAALEAQASSKPVFELWNQSEEELERAVSNSNLCDTLALKSKSNISGDYPAHHLALQILTRWTQLLESDLITTSSKHWRKSC